jgi:ElaB/YqjD/DUF883 family membrane-anchored ribosome-binding protein
MAQNDNLENAAKVVEEKIEASRDSLGEKAAKVRAKVGDVADDMKQRAKAIREKFNETSWEDVTTNASNFVRDNPGKSVGIALAAGFLLGLLFRRRDD